MPDLNRDHSSDGQRHDPRELTYRDLERLDEDQALTHQRERTVRGRRAPFSKDDRRSSERHIDGERHFSLSADWLTARERSERWPLG
jgi:hypothetical protein